MMGFLLNIVLIYLTLQPKKDGQQEKHKDKLLDSTTNYYADFYKKLGRKTLDDLSACEYITKEKNVSETTKIKGKPV